MFTRLILVFCLFNLFSFCSATLPSADDFTWGIGRVESSFGIIGSHANKKGVVVEALGSGDLLTVASYAEGNVRIRISNPTTDMLSLNVNLKVRMPDASGLKKVPLPVEPCSLSINVAPRRTLVVDFPFKMSEQLWNLLGERTAGFGLSTLDFTVSANADNGEDITPLVATAHVGYAPSRTVRLEPPSAAVRMHQGIPMLEINGEFQPSNFGYVGWNWGASGQTIREFSAAGRHLYRVVCHPTALWQGGKLDPDRFEKRMNEIVTAIVGNDPQALIYVFWWLHTPRDWADSFPGETIVYDNGSDATPHGQAAQRGWRRPSLSSKVWRDQQDTIMREASLRILNGPYADRVFGASAAYGNSGEWNGYGYHGQLFSDYSEPARQEFVAWLRSEYDSLSALNLSWKTDFQEWSEIRVPSRQDRLQQGWGSFTGPDFPEAVTDYHRFVSDQTVDLIEHYSRLFKEVSGGRWLVAQFYGYFAAHMAWPPYHSLDSGHFALERLLRSDAVDIITYPYGYLDRYRNIGLGNAIASIQAAGKLFAVECDLATHLNGKINNPISAHHEGGLSNSSSTLAAYKRDFGRVSTGGLGAYWYDFGRGWYLFPGWPDFVDRVEEIREWQLNHSQASVAEVAVIIDENSAFRTGPHSMPYGRSLYNTLCYELDEAGAPWQAFLATDIDKVLEHDFKVIILLNAIDDAWLLADKLRDSAASIVWGYGAGLLEDGHWSIHPETDFGSPSMLVQLNVEAGPLIYCTEGGDKEGRAPESGIYPRIKIDADGVTPVARFADGTLAVASRVNEDMGKTDYWLGTPQLDRELLNLIYRGAGVHQYTIDGSATYANATSVSVWRPQGGGTQIFLPAEATEVIDAWSGKIVGRNTATIEVPDTTGEATANLYLLVW